MGKSHYAEADNLLITADCGGSNRYRVRLWKLSLQEFANETGLKISVCHFPPGTGKWNKIEHRMFCYISMNWRGKPLVSHEVVVNLIGSTTTRNGLRIQSELDTNEYQKGKKISAKEMKNINTGGQDFMVNGTTKFGLNVQLNYGQFLSGIDPHFLILEFTESLLFDDIEQKIDQLNQLKKQGVRLSIDDFGTGYSSLSYLRKLPLDELKIDRSFIMNVPEMEDSSAIVSSVIFLARKLGLSTVAEGMETEEQ